MEQETLVVVSKLKKYVKSAHGLNTSATAISAISEAVRKVCDEAAAQAKSDGRKTLLDRDFQGD
ncbi:MAG: hypothetical protein OXB88_08290 [Bacteriovoracales bacterium]|nr:hypothetical protein [Bacteriovoracales bacterium]